MNRIWANTEVSAEGFATCCSGLLQKGLSLVSIGVAAEPFRFPMNCVAWLQENGNERTSRLSARTFELCPGGERSRIRAATKVDYSISWKTVSK